MCASFKLQMSLDLSFEWKAVDHSGFAMSVAGILWNAQIHDSCDVVGKAYVQPSTIRSWQPLKKYQFIVSRKGAEKARIKGPMSLC